jgi:hypothetical protein
MEQLALFSLPMNEGEEMEDDSADDETESGGENMARSGKNSGDSDSDSAASELPRTGSTGTGTHQKRRRLPNKEVTDANFDDAYVSFILYCNPMFPVDIDTIELRKSFRTPPKSDGKTFSTFSLFELFRKLDEKEIKTWAELAVKLGVEPPVLEKGEMAQKVQQYAVRLKVSHVYFSYLFALYRN